MHYIPISLPFFLLLFFLFVFLIILIEVGILEYAYTRIGVNRRYVFALLFLSLVGSYVNIPVAQLPTEHVHSGEIVNFFGVPYVVPVVREWPGTVVAVNVGGAVIPFILSLYLLAKNRLFKKGLLGIAIVAVIVHMMAE